MGFYTRLIGTFGVALSFHFHRYALEWLSALVVALLVVLNVYVIIAPPRNFLPGTIVAVESGMPAPRVAEELIHDHVVTHPRLLYLIWRITGTSNSIKSGAYRFAEPPNLLTVAWRLVKGAYGTPATRITFIEGITVQEMAQEIAKKMPQISQSDFISAAQPYEGYLFPDTYIFPPSASAESIVATLRANFDTKTAELAPDIAASGHSLSDIVIMASIVEREARRTEDRRMVAGILWNRVRLGMPLQVDAVFGYIYGRPTYSPSAADLQVDSPYNTYKYAGLPPAPISNPGLDALEAVLHPAQTNDLFYITGNDGLMHYATTYAGQKANIAKYLN